jgi:hypothetical protein
MQPESYGESAFRAMQLFVDHGIPAGAEGPSVEE